MKHIDKLKKQLDAHRPLPPETVRSLKEHLIVEWTYHSNSIEGNTLTLSETKVVIQDGMTVGGKTWKEHLEAINHKEAILFLEDVVERREPISERIIKELHALILQGIDKENAGKYRQVAVVISGATHIPPEPWKVQEEMNRLISWYEGKAQTLHPVERAAILHCEFVRIHPFVDGNGRTARLLLNMELMRSGYVPVVIKAEQRAEYYDALNHYGESRDPGLFVEMVKLLEEEALRFYLRFVPDQKL